MLHEGKTSVNNALHETVNKLGKKDGGVHRSLGRSIPTIHFFFGISLSPNERYRYPERGWLVPDLGLS